LLFASHIGRISIRKEEKKVQSVEEEVVFEKEYIMGCSSAE
jgi:hypothetical protein